MALYQMDVERCVLGALAESTEVFVTESLRELYQKREGKYITAASEILVPFADAQSTPDLLRSVAFCGGAVVALTSFMNSDIDADLIPEVMKSFHDYSEALGLLKHHNPAKTKSKFDALTQRGLIDHPEIRDHLDYLMAYYSGVADDPKLPMYASVGLGFTTARLDDCHASVATKNIFGAVPGSIDWNQELKQLTAE